MPPYTSQSVVPVAKSPCATSEPTAPILTLILSVPLLPRWANAQVNNDPGTVLKSK